MAEMLALGVLFLVMLLVMFGALIAVTFGLLVKLLAAAKLAKRAHHKVRSTFGDAAELVGRRPND